MMLFRVTADNDFFEDNADARAFKAYIEAGSRAMKYICLVYDPESPLRNMDLPDKKSRALKVAGYEPTPKGRPSKEETDLRDIRTDWVRNAIDLLREMCPYDEDKEILQAYDIALKEYIATAKRTDGDDKEKEFVAKILTKHIPEVRDAKKALQEKIGLKNQIEAELEEEEIEEDRTLELFLEKRNAEGDD